MKDSAPSPAAPLERRRFLAGAAAAAAGGSAQWLEAEERAEEWRVAVIGHTGRGDYGHGIDTLWRNVPGARIVAVADPEAEGLERARERLGVEREGGFADYREMLARIQPSIVAIGPRHIDQHRDMAVAAARAGARGIYMEKPFCRDLEEADAIVAACEEHGTKLAIAHRNRYHPVLPVIRRLVEEGAIGRWLEIRARGKEDARGGGLDLWVLGSHLLNLVHYFAGQPLACSAVLLQDGRPASPDDLVEGAEGTGPLAGNAVHARYEMESGVPVHFDSIRDAGVREAGFGLQLVGTEGVIDLRADAEPLAHHLAGSPFHPKPGPREWTPLTSGGIGAAELVADIRAQVGGHLAAARDLFAAIREDRQPLCSAADGRVVMEMTLAVFASHRQGGARVEMPLERRDHPLAGW